MVGHAARRAAAGISLLLGIAAAAPAGAQSPAAPAPATVTRADLAWRYLLMDASYATADSVGRLSDSTRAAINRIFDRSTLSFFGGRFAMTAAMMDTAITMAAPTYRYERRTLPAGVRIDKRPAREVRNALTARLAALDSTGTLAQPIASARARAALLVDTVSAERSAEFLTDPAALARAVTAEVSTLEKGRNPYARAVGDLWRSYRGASGAAVPMRVIAPKAAASRAVGVLIALHGAGGDENMFAMGYGQGIAARLARENNLLFVSLATTPFMSSAVNFDSLTAVLGRDYQLDATRIYVIGHSMGAGAAARLAQERPQALAAVVCLAGGSAVTAAGAPPILFIGAQLDPVIPAARVKAAAAATPSGTYEERANEGHTLMVRGGVLRSVPWLLQHTRTR
ncbi:serine aminopeptidase domain-containing protein [Gemmatimonas sp.]|jgi:predicted esterase|uniref:serine aminopeptidase domain-containing protein n=1 Tax=Gemmatimonas sp. TaxID=1962908 RepID=UPI0037C12FB5